MNIRIVIAALVVPGAAFAQQPPAPASPPSTQQTQAQPAAPPPSGGQQPQAPQPQNFQHSPAWANLPKMQLERQFAGPLQDTIVQRWRDPVDGTICYIYLPISAPVYPPNAAGFQQYGANTIGGISCMAGSAHPVASSKPPAKR